ncbi:MAG: LUD domain-containing protein [Caldilineales bacterium]
MPSPFETRVAEALADSDLRTAQARASGRLQRWRNAAFDDLETPWPELQAAAATSRRAALDNLPDLLEQLEVRLRQRGTEVIWAEDGAAVVRYIAALAIARGVDTTLRSRSPLAEEIGLDGALTNAGIRVINTHFGDYILQLAGDAASHPHFPALHELAVDVANLFENKLDMPKTLDPQAMGSMARFRLRRELLRNEMTIGQLALAAADTGTLVLVSDAGEDRLAASLARVQVVLMSIDQIAASLDEALFLAQMASRSAAGHDMPGSLTLLNGPAQVGDPDGPGELHLVIVDNGRSALLATPYRDALACIGCGACHNVCPVTREIGGQAYGNGYAGPIGAVMAPLVAGTPGKSSDQQVVASEIPLLDPAFTDLPLASTLCGACADVCPVGIDLPEMLRSLREARLAAGQASLVDNAVRSAFRWATDTPTNFRRAHGWLARSLSGSVAPPLRAWRAERDLPKPAGKPFRDRWAERSKP